jgi:hypothetical protein
MLKNVASQKIGAQLVSATDGSAFTGSVTVYVTVDAGSQEIGSVGAGVCTHEGNGYHTYAPAQAETNGDLVAFTFIGSGAVPVSVQVYTQITPGAAGGALIAGSNAATTFASVTSTGAFTISDGLAVTASTANRSAISATGNGTGNGVIFVGGGGATSAGMLLGSTATAAGVGLYTVGSGSAPIDILGIITGSVTGSVGSVAADVEGKIIGGGSGTITGTGVRAVDGSGNAIAPASATTAIQTGTDEIKNLVRLDTATVIATPGGQEVSIDGFPRLKSGLVAVGMVAVFHDINDSDVESVHLIIGYDVPSETITFAGSPAFVLEVGDMVDLFLAHPTIKYLPNIAAGSNGGLPTVNASNQVLALDGSGAAIAPASTALTNETWTDEKAGFIDQAFSSLDTSSSPNLLFSTTVASGSGTTYTLAGGSTVNDAFNGETAIFYDADNSNYPSKVHIIDYIAASKTIVVDAAPNFTPVVGDPVKIIASDFSDSDRTFVEGIDADTNSIVNSLAGAPTEVVVGSMTVAALRQMVLDDTGETEATDGSVAALGGGEATINQQDVRDSLLLPPTIGLTPDVSSIDGRIPTALIDGRMDSNASVTFDESDVNNIANQLIAANATILTDIDQDPVADSQVFRVVRRSTGLTADSKTLRVGSANLYAFNFRNVGPANRQIITVNSIALASGTAGGITFGTAGRDGPEAKVRMTGVTAGDYTVKCTVTFYGGWSDAVVVPVKVVN